MITMRCVTIGNTILRATKGGVKYSADVHRGCFHWRTIPLPDWAILWARKEVVWVWIVKHNFPNCKKNIFYLKALSHNNTYIILNKKHQYKQSRLNRQGICNSTANYSGPGKETFTFIYLDIILAFVYSKYLTQRQLCILSLDWNKIKILPFLFCLVFTLNIKSQDDIFQFMFCSLFQSYYLQQNVLLVKPLGSVLPSYPKVLTLHLGNLLQSSVVESDVDQCTIKEHDLHFC